MEGKFPSIFNGLYQCVDSFEFLMQEGKPLFRLFNFGIQFPDQIFRFVRFGNETDVVFPGIDICFKLTDFTDKLFTFADNFGLLVFCGI